MAEHAARRSSQTPPATGRLRLAADHWSQGTGPLLCVACYGPPPTGRLVLNACYQPPSIGRRLIRLMATYDWPARPPPASCRPLLTADD